MIRIIGTSHISPQSIREIRETIAELKPDCVAVELDQNRLEALKRGEKISLSAIKYLGFRGYLFAKILSFVQHYLGKKTGVIPGDEMLEAIKSAKKIEADIALIDRDIGITIRRLQKMKFMEKVRLLLTIFRRREKIDLSKVPADELIDSVIMEIKKASPTLYHVLIHERDVHMARVLKQLEMKYENIVAVVGAGHRRGLERELKKQAFEPNISYSFTTYNPFAS
jgi:pheromone shutdown-related protein TraB